MSLAPYEVLPCGKARPFSRGRFLRADDRRREGPFAWSEPQITTREVYQRGVTFPTDARRAVSASTRASAPSRRPGRGAAAGSPALRSTRTSIRVMWRSTRRARPGGPRAAARGTARGWSTPGRRTPPRASRRRSRPVGCGPPSTSPTTSSQRSNTTSTPARRRGPEAAQDAVEGVAQPHRGRRSAGEGPPSHAPQSTRPPGVAPGMTGRASIARPLPAPGEQRRATGRSPGSGSGRCAPASGVRARSPATAMATSRRRADHGVALRRCRRGPGGAPARAGASGRAAR